MNRTLFLLMTLLSFQLSAMEIDSVERAKLIREGQHELCELIEHNAHVTSPDQRKFLVMIDGEPPAVTYVQEKRIDGVISPILTQQTVDAINAEIALAYTTYNVEMYVIVIKSLNFVVKAPIPAYPSAVDLFTNHLYDAQSNIQELRAIHQDLTYEILYNTFQARGKDCMVYSRAEYSGAYVPGKVGKWTLSKHYPFYATSPTYPKLNELMSCVYDRVKNNPNVVYSNLEPALKEVAHQFYLSAKYMAVKGAIMTTYSTEGMSDIFEQFSPGADYENLTEPERRRALSVFAGYAMGENGIELEERYAIRIIASTPSEQAPAFLDHLSQISELNSNPNYQGNKPNQSLIRVLVHRMDDVGSGPNNYTNMMTCLTRIAMSNESFAAAHMPATDQEWVDRRIYWDDWHALTTPPVGTHDYEVVLNDDGTVSVKKEVVDKHDEHIQGQTGAYYYTPHWDESYSPVQFDPFDFVIFTNRSSLGMLQVAGAAPDQPFIAPAIFLKYADDKAFNTNAITVTAIVLDVVAITTGPFAILGAYSAGNFAVAAYEALQFLGSSLNLIANAAASDEFKEAVGVFNVLIAGWGLAKISVTGAKYTADYLSAVTRGDVQPVPLQTAELYCSKYDDITDWSNVDAATKEEMRRMREMLGKQVASVVSETNLISDRTNWYNNLVNQYGPINVNNFHTNGISANSVPTNTYNDMLSQYPNSIPMPDKTRYLGDLISSGSTPPVGRTVSEGTQLVKIVPKDQKVSAYTAFFMTVEEFNSIESSALIEQKLGLPLSSHSIRYDVYSITATSEARIFESTVASTVENGYNTVGGAMQTLVIDRTKWSAPTFLKTITPPVQP